jgi:hypothetical protein
MVDIGADGIDIDWEDHAGAAASNKLGPIIENFRKSIGINNLLCLAAFSVGAYGSGPFSNETPVSQNTGMCIKGLQSNGKMLDWVNIMSYDASPAYDPIVAFAAYRSYYKGPIMLGCEVPPEAWGGHILTLDEVKSYCKCVSSDSIEGNGIFVWSYQKSGSPSCSDIINTTNQFFNNNSPTPTPTPTTPTPKPNPTNPTPTPIPTNPTPTPTPIPTNPTPTEWVSGKKYNLEQTVLYNNKKYVCKNSKYSSKITPGTIVWSLVDDSITPLPSNNSNNWNFNSNYLAGDIVLFKDNKYQCLQPHTSLPNWCPDNTPALWKLL